MSHIVEPLLVALISNLFKTGVFNKQLKTARVTPVYRSDDPTNPSNFRPISVLNQFSKIYEKILVRPTRLVSFLEKKNVLFPSQFGFRKKRSTYMALAHVVDHIVDALAKGIK